MPQIQDLVRYCTPFKHSTESNQASPQWAVQLITAAHETSSPIGRQFCANFDKVESQSEGCVFQTGGVC